MSFNIKTILESEVTEKKNELVKGLQELEEEREETEFLKSIAEDYKRYNQFILAQKEMQVNELMKILDYLDQLMETQAVTKYTLEHTKKEQKRVVEEIKSLQDEMNSLISKTKY